MSEPHDLLPIEHDGVWGWGCSCGAARPVARHRTALAALKHAKRHIRIRPPEIPASDHDDIGFSVEEQWVTSPVRGDRYEVSNFGRVRTVWKSGKQIKKQTIRKQDRRPVVTLGDKQMFVHRLVALAFPQGEGDQVRHLDGNCQNNAASNLMWGTVFENMQDQVKHGVHHMARRTHCPHGHEFTPENIYFQRPNQYGRKCRTCALERSRAKRKGGKPDD